MVVIDTVGAGTGPTFRMEAAQYVPGGVQISTVMNALPWSSLQRIADGNDTVQTPTT